MPGGRMLCRKLVASAPPHSSGRVLVDDSGVSMPMSLMFVCFPSIIARIVSPSMTLETVVAYECCGTNARSVCQFFEPLVEVDGASGGSDRTSDWLSDWLSSSEPPQAPKEAAKSAVANSTRTGGRVFIACLWVGSFLCCLIPLSTWV